MTRTCTLQERDSHLYTCTLQESELKKQDLDSYTRNVSDLSTWIDQVKTAAPPIVDVSVSTSRADDQVSLTSVIASAHRVPMTRYPFIRDNNNNWNSKSGCCILLSHCVSANVT